MITVVTHTNNKRPRLLERTVNSVQEALRPGVTHKIVECYQDWPQARLTSLELDDYVVFVDDDDTIHSEAFNICLQCLRDYPGIGLVVTNEVEVDLSGNALKYVSGKRTYSGISHHPRVAHQMCVINSRYVSPEVLDLHNLFDVGIDWSIKASAALRGGAVHIPFYAYRWTQHPNTMFSTEREKFVQAIPVLGQEFRRRWGLPRDNKIPVWHLPPNLGTDFL